MKFRIFLKSVTHIGGKVATLYFNVSTFIIYLPGKSYSTTLKYEYSKYEYFPSLGMIRGGNSCNNDEKEKNKSEKYSFG